jgi:hypothetical protein
MDQPTRNVEAEPEKPKDEKDDDERVKHMVWRFF